MALMPDDYHGFIGPAIVRAIPAIRRGVDLVYTSGPPHSMHLVGLALRKLTRVRWAAEFRDPWIDNANQPRYARSRTADRIRAWLERLCLENADFLISATASAGRNLARRTGREDILVARTGIAADTLAHGATSQPHAPTSERRILYMGNLYHQRDPRPLFHAIAALRERGELPAAGVRIDLYGDCEWFHDVSVTGAARDAGIGDLVHVHGRVPLDQARQFIRDADLLLLLAQDQPVQVPQKLFEYLAVQRPIIAFADAGSETADILESLGGHTIISDPADAAPALRRALQQHDFARPDPVAFAELSADRQMDVLVRRIEEARRPADRGMMRPSHASRVG
jgi:glycosyltransferase involved in cell wall biosynthesis